MDQVNIITQRLYILSSPSSPEYVIASSTAVAVALSLPGWLSDQLITELCTQEARRYYYVVSRANYTDERSRIYPI